MFNALNGLGGGGQLNANKSVSNNATVALYSTFATVSFFSGTICNRLGIKTTLSFGGFGYAIYSSGFLVFNHTENSGYVIFAGALLGVCAGLLWTAQGAIMMSYPLEKDKGRYVGIFWMIFNLGAVLGSLIPLAQTVNNSGNGAVGDGTYVGFLVLMLLGAVLAWFLLNTDKIVRSDGSRVIAFKHPTWSSEFIGLFEVLKMEPWIVALFPMFFASNWFYAYQFNDVNLAKFSLRTRALNNLLYWLAQIIGAFFFGYALDIKRFSRTTRARGGWAAVFLLTIGIWGGGLAFQLGYTYEDAQQTNFPHIDWADSDYGGPVFLYICYGLFDAIWQTYVYWTMGALSNNSRKLAIYAGFYKALQSAGSAIVYRLDTLNTPYISMFGSTWGLLGGSLLIAAPVIFMKIKDHTSVVADVAFSDETAIEKFEQKNE